MPLSTSPLVMIPEEFAVIGRLRRAVGQGGNIPRCVTVYPMTFRAVRLVGQTRGIVNLLAGVRIPHGLRRRGRIMKRRVLRQQCRKKKRYCRARYERNRKTT